MSSPVNINLNSAIRLSGAVGGDSSVHNENHGHEADFFRSTWRCKIPLYSTPYTVHGTRLIHTLLYVMTIHTYIHSTRYKQYTVHGTRHTLHGTQYTVRSTLLCSSSLQLFTPMSNSFYHGLSPRHSLTDPSFHTVECCTVLYCNVM